MNYKQKICLLCTKKLQTCIDIYSKGEEELKHIDKLNYLITDLVLPAQNLPINICKTCSKNLKHCYDFKKQCIVSIQNWKEGIEKNKSIKNKIASKTKGRQKRQPKSGNLSNVTKDNKTQTTKRRGFITQELIAEEDIKQELIAEDDIKQEYPDVEMPKVTDTSTLLSKLNFNTLKSKLKTNIKVTKIEKIETIDGYSEVTDLKIETPIDTCSLLSKLNFNILKSKLGTALKTGDNNPDFIRTINRTKPSKQSSRKSICSLCKTCNKQFRSKIALQKHMQLHTRSKRFICNICGKKLLSKIRWKMHMSSHVNGGNICILCHRTYKKKSVTGITGLRRQNECDTCYSRSSDRAC